MSKRMIVKTVATFAVAALPITAAAQATVYHVTDLGAVPGAAACVPTAINDTGVVAGSCAQDGLSNTGVVIWRDGTLVNLGLLPGGHYASATAIKSLGVVAADGDAGNIQPRPLVSSNGALLNMDPQGGANMRTVGITDAGVVFGSYAKGLSGNTSAWSAVFWAEEAGKPGRYRRTALPGIPGGDPKANSTIALGSNKAGQAAGWVTSSLFGQLGAFWNNDAQHSIVALAPLAGAYWSIATGVNDLGQAIGQSGTASFEYHGVLWQNDAAHTPVDLGTLPGDTASTAVAANTAGQVVGANWSSAAGQRAFLWQRDEITELASLVDPLDGFWTIDSVFGINNAGQIIGIGSSNGRSTAVLLTPTVR